MNSILLIIITTCIISYNGFNDFVFFEKYKFNIRNIINKQEYIRLLSSGFLHKDWFHLVFNMLSLYFFRDAVIYFGNLHFFILYLGALFFGNLFSLAIYKNQPWYSSIGASGAVAGVIFSVIALDPFISIYLFFIPIDGYIFGVLYFGYSVYMMLNPQKWDNFGHSAHLGGAIFGMVYSVIMYKDLFIQNIVYIFIMSTPLFYLIYHNIKNLK